MYEILINPITLICLGIVFIFTSLLFFYFKRTFSLLEKTQMDQARVLQGFITNMEMNQQLAMQRQQQSQQQQSGSGINSNESNDSNGSNGSNGPQISASQKLISISDDDSDSDSDGDSDDSDSDDSVIDIDETENDNIVIDAEIIELQNIDNIKVIQLQNNNLEEVNPMIVEIASLEEVNDITINKYENDFDDSDEDDDEDSDEDDEESDDLDEENEKNEDFNKNKEDKIENPSPTITDFKTLNVQTIRQMAIDSELIKTGEKKNKKELIKLLEAANK